MRTERMTDMKRVAFIGSGNMGGALIRAACRAIGPDQVIIADHQAEKAAALAAELGCAAAEDNAAAVEGAEVIFLCVKGYSLEETIPFFIQIFCFPCIRLCGALMFCVYYIFCLNVHLDFLIFYTVRHGLSMAAVIDINLLNAVSKFFQEFSPFQSDHIFLLGLFESYVF